MQIFFAGSARNLEIITITDFLRTIGTIYSIAAGICMYMDVYYLILCTLLYGAFNILCQFF